jgi:hypothetical protein
MSTHSALRVPTQLPFTLTILTDHIAEMPRTLFFRRTASSVVTRFRRTN